MKSDLASATCPCSSAFTRRPSADRRGRRDWRRSERGFAGRSEPCERTGARSRRAGEPQFHVIGLAFDAFGAIGSTRRYAGLGLGLSSDGSTERSPLIHSTRRLYSRDARLRDPLPLPPLFRAQRPRRVARARRSSRPTIRRCCSPTPAWCSSRRSSSAWRTPPDGQASRDDVAEVRARRRQAQRPRAGRPHRAAQHVLRDARQLLVRRLLQARRDSLRVGVRHARAGARSHAAARHGAPLRRRGARALARDRRTARLAHLRTRRQGQLLADGGHRTVRSVLGDLRRHGARRASDWRFPEGATGEWTELDREEFSLDAFVEGSERRSVPRVLESRVHAVRPAGGRHAGAAAEAVGRHGRGARAHLGDHAGRDDDLPHRSVRAADRGGRAGGRHRVLGPRERRAAHGRARFAAARAARTSCRTRSIRRRSACSPITRARSRSCSPTECSRRTRGAATCCVAFCAARCATRGCSAARSRRSSTSCRRSSIRWATSYPELRQRAQHIVETTRVEEQGFLATIEGGLARFEQLAPVQSGARRHGHSRHDQRRRRVPSVRHVRLSDRSHRADGARARLRRRHRRASRRRSTRSASARRTSARRSGSAWRPTRSTTSRSGRLPPRRERVDASFVGYDAIEIETQVDGGASISSDGRVAVCCANRRSTPSRADRSPITARSSATGWRVDVDDVRRSTDVRRRSARSTGDVPLRTASWRACRAIGGATRSAITPRRTCCTRRCARCSARACTRRARSSRPTGCVSTLRITVPSTRSVSAEIEAIVNRRDLARACR